MKKILSGVLLFVSFFMCTSPVFAQEISSPEGPAIIYARGVVEEIVHEEVKEEYGFVYDSQDVIVTLISGEEKEKELFLTYSREQNTGNLPALEIGDKVVIGKQVTPEETYFISDHYRLPAVMWIGAFFVIITLIFARSYGVRAFIGLALSFTIIMYYIVPSIVDGKNPLWVSFIGTFSIAALALFIAHGFKKRTTIAFISTGITILAALGLSTVFVKSAKLFGLGTEEAFYLQFTGGTDINLQGLLLGGIIIGTLGVLDDITTAQSAAVEEIHKANRTLSWKELYRRGSSVGREHIVSLVNTLVLAYTGAALPLLLLFNIYEQPVWLTFNSEIVMEELIRMLVGSTALILAVPLTTILAAWYFGKKEEGEKEK